MRSTRQYIYKAVAVALAMGLIATTPMAALADPVAQITVRGEDGNDTYDAVSNTEGKTGISMSDSNGAKLNGDVTVNGDVSVSDKDTSDSYRVSGVSIYSGHDGTAKLDIRGSVDVAATHDDNATLVEGIDAYTDSNIKVSGDVTATTGNGAAYGLYSSSVTGSTINIGGNVKAASKNDSGARGITIIQTADVTVGGNVEALDSKEGTEYSSIRWTTGLNIGGTGSETKIGKSIIAEGYDVSGIYADTYGQTGSVEVNVGGDVKSSGTYNGTGIYINGNNDSVDVKVGGDIRSSHNAIYVYDTGENASTKITVVGTVSAKNGHAILVENTDSKTTEPEITVWKIESTDSLIGVYNYIYDDREENTEAEEKIKSNINYIIKTDATENGKSSSNGKIMLTGTKGTVTVGDKIYETAHQNDTITINVEVASGYKYSLSNGEAILKANPNGSYTITVPAGGGVDLKAVLEKIEEQRKNSSTRNSDRYSSGSSSSSNSGTVPTVIYAPSTGTQAGDASWSYDNAGWKLKKPDGSFVNGEWRQVSWNGINNWYHFNSNGYADSGWFTDTDGQRYYFYNNHDGAFGRMLTGWNEIDGQWYYFNTIAVNGGSLGSLVTDGTTPDGYKVDASGAWVQ